MADYNVKVTFVKAESGAIEYQLPLVYHVVDPKEGMKATVIKGNRGDGSIIIPGGKKSQEIVINGNITGDDYKAITTAMNEMKTKVTSDVAILTLKHLEGVNYVTDWSYTVRRINEIKFPQSLRTGKQEYNIVFYVLSY